MGIIRTTLVPGFGQTDFVKPGGKLSMQYHNHRAEHWVVVEGIARVTNGEETFDAGKQSRIPIGTKHRLENPSDEPLRSLSSNREYDIRGRYCPPRGYVRPRLIWIDLEQHKLLLISKGIFTQ